MAKLPEKVGRYTIEDEVGQGGMAKVYVAYDPNVKRQVALKLMSAHLTEDDEFRARFRREAEAVAALEHVGIVPIYDFGEDQDQLFIVMRLMGGGTLKERIIKGSLDLEEVAKIFRRIALALDKAHESGIVHRDLKPGNILFDQDGEGYIADFGVAHLAKSGEELTGTGALIGTPSYMSPEQVRGANDEVDGRSDIYSLGVILFEMLSGKTPYNSDTPMGTALMHLLEPVPRLLESNPNLPSGVEDIINKAMAKEKEDRYDKAKDLADALDEIVAGSYMPTQKMDDGEKVQETIARHKKVEKKEKNRKGLIYGIVGIAILAVAGVFLSQSGLLGGGAQPDATEPGDVVVGVEPTATIQPTEEIIEETPAADAEPTAEATPEPTPVPALAPESIAASNVGTMKELARLGRGTINDVALSPDGSSFAVTGSIGIWVYDIETLELISNFESSDGVVFTSIAWSPDAGTPRVITGGVDGSLRVWNPTTGQQLLNIRAHQEAVTAVAWSPDGESLVSGSTDNTIKFWNSATGGPRFTLEGHQNDITDLGWSPDGQYFVASGWVTLVWDLSLSTNVRLTLGGHTKQIESLSWSPDSTQLISASEDATMRIWNITSGDLLSAVEGQDAAVYAAAWSPDAEQVLQAAGKEIRVRSASMEILEILEGHTTEVRHIEWFGEEAHILSVGANGEMLLWDSTNWELIASNGDHTNAKQSTAISPDGSKAVSGSNDGIVRVWEIASGNQLAVFNGHEGAINEVAWSADGANIATASDDGTAKIWEAESYTESRLLLGHNGAVLSIEWSPDGSLMATTGADGTIRIWNAEDGTERNNFGQNEAVVDLTWSPDGNQVAVASGNEVWIRIVDTGGTIFSFTHDAKVNGVAWSPNGRFIATTSDDKTVNLWGAQSGVREAASWFGHSKASTALVWAPNSAMLFSADANGDIIVWDVATGSQIHVLSGHTDQINGLMLLDDLLLASTGQDGTIRVWGVLN